MRRELKGKGRKSALVLAQADAVEPDRGGGHDAFKVDKDTPAAGFGGQAEAAAIDGDKLVGLLVEAVPGLADIGMGHSDAGKAGVVEVAGVGGGRGLGAIAPIAVDGQHHASRRDGSRFGGITRGYA